MDISEEDYQKAVAVVRKCLSGSVSNLQRKLYWGYGRAASAIDRMQDEFIVSPMSASGRRDVYPEETHELWKELQAARAQAVPEVKPSHTVTLTCAQLLEAFRFGAPDEDDPEQLKTEMTIIWSDVGHSGKGYYCYYSELPEEGAIFLDEEGDAQEST